jgi:hypothetical protein
VPEEKTQWQKIVSNELEEVIEWAKVLKNFLEMFFDFRAAWLPVVENLPDIVGEVIKMLEKLVNIASTIKNEVSKEEVNWEKIKEVFPTREWLGSIEATLTHLDHNKKFRAIMPYYEGKLKEDYVKHILTPLQNVLHIFSEKLGHKEIYERYTEALATEPMTEEEIEREYKERNVFHVEDLPTLFNEIAEILTRELGGEQGFSEYWKEIEMQFNNALQSANVYELRDVYRQIVVMYESLPEDKRKAYKSTFDQFFTAIRDYALPLLKVRGELKWGERLLKFKLIRHLLGLE